MLERRWSSLPGEIVSPLFALNGLAVLFLTGTTLTASLTSHTSFSSVMVWFLGGLVIVFLGIVVGWKLLAIRLGLGGDMTSVFAGGAMGGVAMISLLRDTAPSWFPTPGSADVVHHYALVQYLFESGVVPSSTPSPQFLGEMAQYPYAAHANAAIAATLLQIAPLRAMTLVGYLVLALAATVVVELARRLIQDIWPALPEGFGIAGAVAAASMFIAGPHFTRAMLMDQYFYSQVLGLYVILFCTLALFEFCRGDTRRRAGMSASAISAFLLSFAYPLFSALPIATLGLVLLARRRSPWRRWLALLPVTAGTVVGTALFLPGKVSTGLAIARNEGAISPTPLIASVGGPIEFALMVIGLVAATTVLIRRRQSSLWLPVAAIVAAGLQTIAMYVARQTFDFGSYYMANKLFYLLAWLALPFAGIGVIVVGSIIVPKRTLGVARLASIVGVGAVLVASFVLVIVEDAQPAVPLIDPNTYALARWVHLNIGGQGEYAMAEGGAPAYMTYVGVLNQNRDAYALGLISSQNSVDGWLADAEVPYLVTSNLEVLEPIIEEFDLRIVYRQGEAALISK